jgi:hypothetical protein
MLVDTNAARPSKSEKCGSGKELMLPKGLYPSQERYIALSNISL